MRRISSLFRSKHNDASKPQPLIIPSSLSTPVLTASSNPSHSSASSSGSASVRTPEDDPNARFHSKKSWLPSWLSSKRSGTLKRSAEFDDRSQRSDFVPPHDTPVASAPLRHTHDTDDDSSEDSEDDNDDNDDQNDNHDRRSVLPPTPTIPNPLRLEKSRKHLETLISNSLSPSSSSPPLYHLPGTYQFPRSSNISRLLSHQDTLHTRMLKSHLLHTLQHKTTLSSSDARLLASFGSRTTPTLIQRTQPPIDDPAVDPTRFSSVSHGLSRWMSRPCFEDRFIVWLPSQDSPPLIYRPVTGSGYAVAELEFSEAIETLAGLDFARPSPREDFNPLTQLNSHQEQSESSSSASSSSSSLSVPSASRNAPYKSTPSPLRMQHGPSSPPISPISPVSPASNPTSAVEPDNQPTPVKRGVRFAEDGKEDQIPLAYVLRIKKQREEKARFLREERERRAFEEERRKQESERMERERERREWERERKAWEMEKKTIEEERKARLYAEEIASARQRRESARAGGTATIYSNTAPSSPQLSAREPEDRRRRDSRGYSRPAYDSLQRRQFSEPSMTTLDHGGYPGSSRPPSIGHGGVSPSGSGSRPASIYSDTMSSSEDARAAAANGSVRSKKRGSVASLASQKPSLDHRSSSYSGGYEPVPPVPPVPQPFAIDVPLLPPTPPFMMQQFPRPRSSQSASSGSSKPKMAQHDSSDRMDAAQQRRSNVSVSPHRERGSHRRRASGENFTPVMPDRGRSHSQSQPNSLSRGTTPQLGMFPQSPGYLYSQSPWTALPTMAQLQQAPMAMVFNGNPQLGQRPTTAIS